MEEDTDYTVDKVNGQVTFIELPPLGVNNVIITYTKFDPEMRQLITRNKYYGGVYYARHWIFGNPDRMLACFTRAHAIKPLQGYGQRR